MPPAIEINGLDDAYRTLTRGVQLYAHWGTTTAYTMRQLFNVPRDTTFEVYLDIVFNKLSLLAETVKDYCDRVRCAPYRTFLIDNYSRNYHNIPVPLIYRCLETGDIYRVSLQSTLIY